jgi:outer membrane lipoprotein LolB
MERRAGVLAIAACMLSGCAQLPRSAPLEQLGADRTYWTGRMSLQVQSEPPQAFSAGFELQGSPTRGELKLNSPLGTVLGLARWAPGQASLVSGNQTREFASVDALIESATGAALPLGALFDWLSGKDTRLNGWVADLSRHPDGRIAARRLQPQPESELRVVLDQ